ncbi:uncharacterized protein LOC112095641 [Citrus clementina]|uniref:uncharacterized protein LOC112095641 n=1 Tax=Citrus clementina TaxID=85681 RepID=UPI000CED61B0|nr:uncharacterized protein LOC112095641 [Citrus x clementina]
MDESKNAIGMGSEKVERSFTLELVIPFHYIDNFKKLFILSMMAVGQICPHRLAVQDISLSRRQRGFDFPWG